MVDPRPRRCAFAGLVVAACSFDTSGVASAGGSGALESGATTSASSAGDEEATGSSEGSASGSATTMPATTAGSATSAADTGASSSDDSTTIDPSQGSSSGGAPDTAHLQHGTHATCNQPMWCVYGGNLYDPAGGPTAGAECFEAPFAPAQITAIQYSVGAVSPQVVAFTLEVYTSAGGMPGIQLVSLPMSSADATVGDHELVVDPPIDLADSSFCVGFRTYGSGLDGALGFASSEDSQAPGESWWSSDFCSLYSWADVIAVVGPPRGNWCISVDIASSG